jgi:NodT family efflux transporter outer membrane factor (OMF) lipoprotein
MTTRFNTRLAIIAVFAALGACSLTPTYERPQLPTPNEWQAADTAKSDTALAAHWWRRFGSTELDELVAQALAANHDLAAAASRIEQARATAQIANSRLLPYASASVAGSRDRQMQSGAHSVSSSDQSILAVSYEVDLWGANDANVKAAATRVAVREYDFDATRLVLQADVAANFFQALALKDRLAIAQKNLDAARRLMSLVEVRFKNGAATGLDIAQQRTTLLSIEAELPVLQQSLVETQSALALLLGRAPQEFGVRAASLADITLPSVAAGQPADLLERRPDVRAAEADLIAANADIGAARAALYPSLDLSAAATVTGWLTGGTTTVASMAASLAQTLFDGGELRAQVAQTEAVRRELVENYAQTVLTSFKEVHDGLSAVATNADRAALLSETAQQAQLALQIASVRYQAGSEDLLTLLESQRSQLSAEDSLVQAQLARYNASLGLFKALGGGWSATL